MEPGSGSGQEPLERSHALDTAAPLQGLCGPRWVREPLRQLWALWACMQLSGAGSGLSGPAEALGHADGRTAAAAGAGPRVFPMGSVHAHSQPGHCGGRTAGHHGSVAGSEDLAEHTCPIPCPFLNFFKCL